MRGWLLVACSADAGSERCNFRCSFLKRGACAREGGGVPKRLRDATSERHRFAKRNQIAWRCTPHRHAACDTRYILHAVARGAQFFAHAFVGNERGDSVLARADRGAITQRRAGPFAEQASTHGGARSLQDAEERAFGSAGAEGSFNF